MTYTSMCSDSYASVSVEYILYSISSSSKYGSAFVGVYCIYSFLIAPSPYRNVYKKEPYLVFVILFKSQS